VRQLRMWVSSKRQTVSLKSRIYIGACPVEKHLPAEYRSKFNLAVTGQLWYQRRHA
jgi:hypothetical protein